MTEGRTEVLLTLTGSNIEADRPVLRQHVNHDGTTTVHSEVRGWIVAAGDSRGADFTSWHFTAPDSLAARIKDSLDRHAANAPATVTWLVIHSGQRLGRP